VRFEVLMAVTLKNTIFWDVMLCCLVAVYWCSSETLVNFYQTTLCYIPEILPVEGE
jgi:hypothetical protein